MCDEACIVGQTGRLFNVAAAHLELSFSMSSSCPQQHYLLLNYINLLARKTITSLSLATSLSSCLIGFLRPIPLRKSPSTQAEPTL